MTTTIFCPRTKNWEKFFQSELDKLLQEHSSLVLTAVNIEQIYNFNHLPLKTDSAFTGVILESNYIYNCLPYSGNVKDFKKNYPGGIVFKKKPWWRFF